jgi:hypothetical protein
MKYLSSIALVLSIIAIGAAFFYSTVVKQSAQQTLGSIVGPDSLNPYFSVNNVFHYENRNAIRTATTTVCVVKSPAATSTLTYGAIHFAVSSSTALTVVAAKSLTPYATTTLINSQSVAGPSGDLRAASTTISNEVWSDMTFGPNQYLVFSETGGITAGDATGAGFVPTGSCIGDFTSVAQ